MDYHIEDSPVEKIRKTLPCGDGKFIGFDHVYSELKKAVYYLASDRRSRCGDTHVFYMAVLGCGHEETMKHYMAVAHSRGFTLDEQRQK